MKASKAVLALLLTLAPVLSQAQPNAPKIACSAGGDYLTGDHKFYSNGFSIISSDEFQVTEATEADGSTGYTYKMEDRSLHGTTANITVRLNPTTKTVSVLGLVKDSTTGQTIKNLNKSTKYNSGSSTLIEYSEKVGTAWQQPQKNPHLIIKYGNSSPYDTNTPSIYPEWGKEEMASGKHGIIELIRFGVNCQQD